MNFELLSAFAILNGFQNISPPEISPTFTVALILTLTPNPIRGNVRSWKFPDIMMIRLLVFENVLNIA